MGELRQLKRQQGAASQRAPSGTLASSRIAPSAGTAGSGHDFGAVSVHPAEPRLMRTPDDGEAEGPTSPLLSGSPELERVWAGSLVIGEGAAGDFVERIQLALLADDPSALPRFGADGKFGAETKQAVRDYQQRRGLAADGVVGPQTLRALDAPAPQAASTVATPAATQKEKPKPRVHLQVPEVSSPSPDLVFPLYQAYSFERTFVRKELPPLHGPEYTIYPSLSLVGSAKLGPAHSVATVSPEDMSVEFEKFGTALTYKGVPPNVTFSSGSVDLGKSGLNVKYGYNPLSMTISQKLPKELTIGKSKLSGELSIQLEFRFEPKLRLPSLPQFEPKPKGSPAIPFFAVPLAALEAIGAAAISLVPIFIIVPPVDERSGVGPMEG